jgi:hypothetical protein
MNATHDQLGGMLGGLSGRVHTFFCGLGGHDLVLNVEPSRLSLKCSSCPYETPGWLVKESGATAQPVRRRAVLLPTNVH